jgi:hypothetical protein
MACVRVCACTGLVFDGHLHLMRRTQCNHVAWKDCSVTLDHNIFLVSILHMYGDTIKVIPILLKHKPIRSVFHSRIHWKNNLLFPSLNGDANFKPLTYAILPSDKSLSLVCGFIAKNSVWQIDEERQRSRLRINGVRNEC